MAMTTPDDAPLFAKRGEPLTPEMLREIGNRLCSPRVTPRRRKQILRWSILNDDIKDASWERLREQYDSDVVRKGVQPFLSAALNPGDDVVRRVCQAYSHGVRRDVAGVSKSKKKAFQKLYQEAGILGLGPDWNRLGYFCGPTFILPQVRAKRMRVSTIAPHQRELVLDDGDPTGPPVAVAYMGTDVGTQKRVIVVTSNTWTEYLHTPGGLVVHDVAKLEAAPTAGRQPFAGLRFDAPLTSADYDRSSSHDRLTDATIDVTAISAVMGYTRKAQNKWLLFLTGQLEKMAKGQNLGDPVAPLVIETDQGRQVQLKSVQFDTPVKNFLEHIRFIYAAGAESTGVPAMIAQDGARIDVEFAYDGLSEFRNEQIQYAHTFELDLAIAMVCAAKDGAHPDYLKLPTVEELEDGFTVEFGQMARRFADPQQQRDQEDYEIRHGIRSCVDLLARRHPLADPEELLKLMRETIERNGEVWDMLASRNVGVDGSGGAINGAQVNGAQGPAVRDKDKVKNDVDQSAS